MKAKIFRRAFCSLLILLTASLGWAKDETVYIVPIKGVIDLGLSGFIKRALEDAKKAEAKAVIFEIDTFGGRVDAAFEICEYIEGLGTIPAYAYVINQAWSAGALIALACDKIFMAPGSSIGSAEPKAMGVAGSEELTDEKTISAVRAKFKAIAEENGHSANLAQGMVDKDIELNKVNVKGKIQIMTSEETQEAITKYGDADVVAEKVIKPAGKLLNLTAKESKELGLCYEIVFSKEALFALTDLKGSKTYEAQASWSENLVRFLTHPVVSSLLMTLGILGIIFEFKAPGWGITGTLAAICLALFFWGHYLVGLANWAEILLFAIGVGLIFVELFVFPGFGLSGAAGIVLIFSGLFLSLIKHPLHIPKIELTQALYIFSYSLIGVFVGGYLILKLAPQTGLWKAAVLKEAETKEGGFIIPDYQIKIGASGRAVSVLRPSGRAQFQDKILDVVSDGDFIEEGNPVIVVRVEGNKIVVTKINA